MEKVLFQLMPTRRSAVAETPKLPKIPVASGAAWLGLMLRLNRMKQKRLEETKAP